MRTRLESLSPLRSPRLRVVLSLFGACLLTAAGKGQQTASPTDQVRYTLRLDGTSADALATSVQVTIDLAAPAAGPRVFIMPRAVPMGYSAQPYDRFVTNLKAFDAAKNPLPVSRADGPRWNIGKEGATVARIEYEVDVAGMERDVLSLGDSSRFRPGYAFILGYSVFGYVEGLEDSAIQLNVYGLARAAKYITLGDSVIDTTWGVIGRAPNFYELADSQIVLGLQVKHGAKDLPLRSGGGGPLRLVTLAHSESDLDFERLQREVGETYEKVENYFGTRPFARYTVIAEYLKLPTPQHRAGFSMEHLQSATFCLEAGAAPKTEQDWARARYNIAHHVAHAWIPKRAYGKGYYPFRWELAPLIDTIWFSEGFGQYAAADALADAMPEAERRAYLERIVEARFRLLREMPAFLKQMPLVELSHLASTQYSEDFRVGRTVFSRGGLMAFEMDMRIREQSKGGKRLRDALRYLLAWSEKNNRAFEISELPAIFKEGTGVETRDILERWLAPMP